MAAQRCHPQLASSQLKRVALKIYFHWAELLLNEPYRWRQLVTGSLLTSGTWAQVEPVQEQLDRAMTNLRRPTRLNRKRNKHTRSQNDGVRGALRLARRWELSGEWLCSNNSNEPDLWDLLIIYSQSWLATRDLRTNSNNNRAARHLYCSHSCNRLHVPAYQVQCNW